MSVWRKEYKDVAKELHVEPVLLNRTPEGLWAVSQNSYYREL